VRSTKGERTVALIINILGELVDFPRDRARGCSPPLPVLRLHKNAAPSQNSVEGLRMGLRDLWLLIDSGKTLFSPSSVHTYSHVYGT
jgi:hypothetical protein